MAKFNAFDHSGCAQQPFDGHRALALSVQEMELHDIVLGRRHDMAFDAARHILQTLDGDVPYRHRTKFCRAFAALAVAFLDDMGRRGHKGR